MAYLNSEGNSFTANITFSHDYTSNQHLNLNIKHYCIIYKQNLQEICSDFLNIFYLFLKNAVFGQNNYTNNSEKLQIFIEMCEVLMYNVR